MVTASEGDSAPTASTAYGGGGGVGGKATRNQFRSRSRTTPYDRPPTARRNPNLLSKLVIDPIRNLVSSAAHRFFASVTSKRLTPPPPLPSESIQEVNDGLEDVVIKNKAEAPEPLTVDDQNLATANTGDISELEQLLKQNTFTRSEIVYLKELLQSKAVDDLPVDSDVIRVEASLSDPAANFEKPRQIQNSPLAENGAQERAHGVISTLGISARDLEEDVASPAELAKAYMGSRASKVSPSMLGLRSQAIREEPAVLSTAPFTPKFPMSSFAPRVTSRLFPATDRSRGRSAIYRMARTPYPRVPRTGFGKGSEPRRYGSEGYSLPSSSLQDQDGEPASTNLALKRRNSVLYDDIGSVSPLRRIRQKHNLSSQRLNLPAPRGIGGASGVLKQTLSLAQKHPLTDEWKNNGLKVVGDNADSGAPCTSYSHVPPKSSEMGARILQQLENVTPKEKSAESKLVTAREKSPVKLTTDMLHGQALRSLEDANSPKLLPSTQGSQRFEDLSQSSLTRVHAFDFREPERIEENCPKTSVRCETATPIVNQNSSALEKDVVPGADGSDAAAKLAAQRPHKKQAFMMSVHEDILDLDEETYSIGPTSEAVVGGRGKSEKFLTNHSSASGEKVVEDQTAVLPEMEKSPPDPIFGKKIDFEVRNAAVVGGEKIGVTFPALQASSFSPPVTLPQTTSLLNKPKQESDKIPTTENSPVSLVPDLASPKPSFGTQPTAESLSSSGAVVPTREVPGSDANDNNKAVEVAEVKGKPENQHSTLSSPPSLTKASFVVPENSKVKNVRLSTGPSAVLPTPTIASTGFCSQTLSAGTSPFSISASVTSFAGATSSSSPFGSSGMPMFQFGSPVNPSSAVSSSASTTSDAAPSVVKTDREKEATTTNLSNTSFGGTSFAIASTGSSIFGLSSSSASLTKSVSDSTASGFMFGAQSSDVGSGAAAVSQNAPFQFGSSASSPVFGSSGVSSFMSNNPMISSSGPATKLFASGASFGLSPPSVETKLVDSGSGPSSGVFSFGTDASTAASGANAFSLGSGSSSTFSFGRSSSATSSLTSAVVSSSNTTPAIFSFGASSSSGTGMISSSAGTSSAIFGGSTLSSSSETNVASSSSAASVLFGSSWQTPNSSPFGATSSSPLVFSMGASSSSFAAANTAPMVFGSATAATSSGLGFSFTAASAATSFSPSSPFTSRSVFGNSASTFTASGNNDQMSMEDSSMVEDVQARAPAVPVFGQQPLAPSPGGFAFGSTVPPQSASPFQFGGQQSQGALQNSSPFQASGSMEFNAGGSFSLGSGGGPGDKSNRRIVRINRTGGKNRKK